MSLISIFQQQQQEQHALQERVTQEHSLAYLQFHEEEVKRRSLVRRHCLSHFFAKALLLRPLIDDLECEHLANLSLASS